MEDSEKKSQIEFDKWSSTFDSGLWNYYFEYSIKNAMEMIRPFLSRDHNCLDIGCATGNFISRLSNYIIEGQLMGVDISEKMIKIAMQKLQKIKNVSLNTGSITNKRFNKKFNHVFCLNAFHHIPKHQEFLKKVNQIMTPNATLMIIDNIKDNKLQNFWIRVIKKIFKEPFAKYYSTTDIKKLLLNSGFELIDEKQILFFVKLFLFKKK